jgi:hypothetical protein
VRVGKERERKDRREKGQARIAKNEKTEGYKMRVISTDTDDDDNNDRDRDREIGERDE